MKYLLLTLCFFSLTSLSAQTIKGIVYEEMGDGKEKSPLPGANVYWVGSSKGVATDANGEFKIQYDTIGKLVFSFIGYGSDTLNVSPSNDFLQTTLVYGERLDQVDVVTRKRGTVMSTGTPLIEQLITGEELCKAACCNLGESFETNASVDVSYADAVTGAKQIQLLGLTGKYVQMLTENMPNFRGLSSLYGLTYIPGPWMSAISVSKGTGSVINGYESMAGQISVDYKKPTDMEILSLNVYMSDEGMYEFNSNFNIHFNEKWATMFLIHGDWMDKNGGIFNQSHDRNKDGFLDMPEKTQYNVINRWTYKDSNWNLQFGGKFIDETRDGGQTEHGGHASIDTVHNLGLYHIDIDTRRYEAFMKAGYLMPQYENTSMAFIANYSDHTQDSKYGKKVYNATQKSLFLNYIYQSIFGNNTNQMYSAGVSFNYDKFDEDFQDRVVSSDTAIVKNLVNFKREERVPGAFFQYTGQFLDERLILMAGLRYDHHNIYDGIWTPRFHLMYKPDEYTNIKATFGRGSRVSNILAENSYLFASSAALYVNGKLLADNPDELKNLKIEDSWNFGANVNRKFELFDRVLNVNIDYYHTKFTDQVVVDHETDHRKVNFYNLDGKSYSNCYQAEVKYDIIPRLETTIAYRYNDVKTTINGELKRAPLTSYYKGLITMSYFTNMKKWQFDFTTQFNGAGRLPEQGGIDPKYKVESRFKANQVMNGQITKYFRMWSVYLGCENIGDFRQKNPIVAANDPWGENFDSSKVWGPIHGRKFYLGLRFALDR